MRRYFALLLMPMLRHAADTLVLRAIYIIFTLTRRLRYAMITAGHANIPYATPRRLIRPATAICPCRRCRLSFFLRRFAAADAAAATLLRLATPMPIYA